MTYTVAKSIWIHKLLADLGLCLSSPTKVYCDNVSASYMTVNPIQYNRSKHTAVDYHFIHERVAYGDLIVRYIPTKLQLADIFTKGLSSKLFDFFKDNLSVHPSPID